MPKINNYDISGCYAQTEIGHGSNVAGLETTAVFEQETDEFVINTPTPTATKWWPGEMGRHANYAMVFARCIVKDKDYGVHPFLVQTRSLENHRHMPGVESGEIGPKVGYTGKDNGWMTLKNVRIPRSQLLQKYFKVSKDGQVSQHGDRRVLYAAMMNSRAQIIGILGRMELVTLLIGLRYSTVRRQFKNKDGSNEEVQIIDYQTQQMKLFPIMATGFAHHFSM